MCKIFENVIIFFSSNFQRIRYAWHQDPLTLSLYLFFFIQSISFRTKFFYVQQKRSTIPFFQEFRFFQHIHLWTEFDEKLYECYHYEDANFSFLWYMTSEVIEGHKRPHIVYNLISPKLDMDVNIMKKILLYKKKYEILRLFKVHIVLNLILYFCLLKYLFVPFFRNIGYSLTFF